MKISEFSNTVEPHLMTICLAEHPALLGSFMIPECAHSFIVNSNKQEVIYQGDTNLWQSTQRVVIQAGQLRIASLAGAAFCDDLLPFDPCWFPNLCELTHCWFSSSS